MSEVRGQMSAPKWFGGVRWQQVSEQIGQSREEFFTLRRQGAKAAYESKDRIPFLNLSGFASLREIAVTKGRPASARGSGLARAGLHGKLAEEGK